MVRREDAADGAVRFVGEEGLGVRLVPGERYAEPGSQWSSVDAAC